MAAPDDPAGGAFDPLDALAGVDVGILCVDAELCLRYANPACEALLGEEPPIGHAVVEVLGDDATIARLAREVLGDGIARCARVTPPHRAPLDLRAQRTPHGLLVLTLQRPALPAHDDRAEAAAVAEEHERLRALTRAMAAEADAEALLQTVCRAAVELCGARGGTVAEIDGDTGTFICAINHPDEVLGRRFRLAGTLSQRAIDEYRQTGRLTASRADSREANDAALFAYFSDGRHVGPLLLAPLGAHSELLGVLAVSRALGEAPFSERDAQRLRVIADHASLALWKARLIEEALAANATKSNFLAMVSHELRTPLTALTGYGELLADEIMGPLNAGQHEIVERVRGVTHQLTAMIEEILTFSSLEAGRELVRPRPLDPAEVLRAVSAVVEPLATQKGLLFACDAADAASIVSDPDKVRQILVNLTGNAVKFTERGEVRVRATRDAGGGARFAVSDTGVGIAASDLGRLFQPFTQLDTGLTRRYGGTGLGLYISRRLAELLGGHVEVESELGRGSTFTLVLPERTPER